MWKWTKSFQFDFWLGWIFTKSRLKQYKKNRGKKSQSVSHGPLSCKVWRKKMMSVFFVKIGQRCIIHRYRFTEDSRIDKENRHCQFKFGTKKDSFINATESDINKKIVKELEISSQKWQSSGRDSVWTDQTLKSNDLSQGP